MLAGKLKHRITIKNLEKAFDSGKQIETYQTLRIVWAAIRCVDSTEVESKAQFLAKRHYEIEMRYQPDLTSEMIIEHGGKTYHIYGVIHNEDLSGTIALCKRNQ